MAVEASRTTAVAAEESAADIKQALRRQSRFGESVIEGFLFFCGAVSIFTTLGIVYVLVNETLLFINKVTGIDFHAVPWTDIGTKLYMFGEAFIGAVPLVFGDTMWQPAIERFGIWSLINSTLIVSGIAMLVALPLGLASAIYLSEYAPRNVRSILKPILEVLAGVPTVVYGYFALTLMTPVLRGIFGDGIVEIYNTAAAGIVVGILVLPMVSSMSEDALSAVPAALRQAAYGLGATKLETAVKVVLPAAASGIAAAFIVAISRAIGETMIVAIAAGAGPREAPFVNPFLAAETMTGHIVRISGGDLSYDSIDYDSIFLIGFMLFVITLALNIVSRWLVSKFREVYE